MESSQPAYSELPWCYFATARSAAAFAAALPDAWVDRLAIVGTVDEARAQLRSLGSSGADRVALIPAYPDLMSSLSSLARLL